MKKNNKNKYKITSPTGEVHVVDKMFKFCKDNDLNPSCMFNVANKKNGRKHHKGWKCELVNVGIDIVNNKSVVKDEKSKSDKGIYGIRNWFNSILKRFNW